MPTNQQHLQILQLDQYATHDDLKSAYRRLSKLCHPDLNKGVDGTAFRKLTESYQYLLQHHRPEVKKVIRQVGQRLKFHRVFGDSETDITIGLPFERVVDQDIVVFCIKGMQEYRLFIDAGTNIPSMLVVNAGNRQIPIHLETQMEYVR